MPDPGRRAGRTPPPPAGASGRPARHSQPATPYRLLTRPRLPPAPPPTAWPGPASGQLDWLRALLQQHALFAKRLDLHLPLRLPFPQPMATLAAAAQDLADLLADYQRHYHPLDDWFYDEEVYQCEPDELLACLLPRCYGLWDDDSDPLEIALSLDEPLRLLAVLALDDVTGSNGLSAGLLAAEYPELALTLPVGWSLDPALTALRGRALAPPFDGLADVLAYLTRQTGHDLLDLSPADLLSYGELPPCDQPTAEYLRAEYRAIQPTLDALTALTAWHAAAPDPAAALRRLVDLLTEQER